jgi:hypothetical protein
MKILKKIILPFFNKERHEFLFKKWWFRALIVVYVIFLIFLLSSFSEIAPAEKCFPYYNENLQRMSSEASEVFTEECLAERLSSMPGIIASSLVITIIAHYIIQLIFFKIIIDYVAMGNKK